MVVSLLGGDFTFAPPNALDAQFFHQSFNGAASKLWQAVLFELVPNFTNAIATATVSPNLFDLLHKVFVALLATALFFWVLLLVFDTIVGGSVSYTHLTLPTKA